MTSKRRLISIVLAVSLVVSMVMATGLAAAAEQIPEGYTKVRQILWGNRTRGAEDNLSLTRTVVDADPAQVGGVDKAVQYTVVGPMQTIVMYGDSEEAIGADLRRDNDTAVFSFYIKLPEGFDNNMIIKFGDDSWSGFRQTRVEIKGGGWQHVEFPVSEMIAIGAELRWVWYIWPQFDPAPPVGTVIEIANMELYQDVLINLDEIEYEPGPRDFGNPYAGNSNVLFAHTDATTAEVEGTATEIKATDDKNGEYFDFAQSVTAGTIADGGKWYGILPGTQADLSADWDEACLRLFLKAPRDNTFVNVGLVDKDGDKLVAGVTVTKANVWQEVQIRLTKLLIPPSFDKSAVTAFFVGEREIEDRVLLAEGEKLLVAGAEVYSGTPVRKKGDYVLTGNTVIADSQNSVDMSFGTYGTLFAMGVAQPDFNNLVNGKNTWRVQMVEDADEGFEALLPFSLENFEASLKNGFFSFSAIADQYVAFNMVISDGQNTYTQEVQLNTEWNEFIVYGYDLINAGIDVENISTVMFKRERMTPAGYAFNFTEFTLSADMADVAYEYKAVTDLEEGSSGNVSDDNSGNTSDDNDENISDNNTETSPVTGDMIPVVAIVALLMAGAVAFLTKKRVFERN